MLHVFTLLFLKKWRDLISNDVEFAFFANFLVTVLLFAAVLLFAHKRVWDIRILLQNYNIFALDQKQYLCSQLPNRP